MTRPTGRPRGRPTDESRRRAALAVHAVTDSDRLAVAIVALPPLRRRALELVASASSPPRTVDLVPAASRWHQSVQRMLVRLWSAGLVVRRGRERSARYSLAAGVSEALGSVPSLGTRRHRLDPAIGLRVLEAARERCSKGWWPSVERVSRYSGVSMQQTATWLRLHQQAGLLEVPPALGRLDGARDTIRDVNERRRAGVPCRRKEKVA